MNDEVEIINLKEWDKRVFVTGRYKILEFNFTYGFTLIYDNDTKEICIVKGLKDRKNISITKKV